MPRREHVGGAPATALTSGILAAAASFTVDDGSGYPTGAVGPFFVVIDPGTSTEEKVLCSSRAGANFTVAGSGRGADNTLAVDHASGAVVQHVLAALEVDEHNAHVVATSGVHGKTSALASLSDAETLTNKTMSGGSNSFSAIPQSAITSLVAELAALVAADAAINTNIDDWDHDAPATFAYTAAPSTYPSGFSIKRILASGGWPVDGFVITFKLADNTRAVQFFGEGGTGSTSSAFFRHYNGSAWQTHRGMSNPTLAGDWLNILASAINGGWANVFAVDPASLRPTQAFNDALVDTTSTSYVFGSPTLGATFVAPPSGQVLVSLYANCTGDTDAQANLAAPEIRTGTLTSSSLVVAADDDNAVVLRNALSMAAGTGPILFTGLTPGATHTVWHKLRVGGGEGHFVNRRIVVEPVA
jgi:hypothetical protein